MTNALRAPAWHLQPLRSSRGDEGRSQRWPVTSRLKFESLVTVSLRRLFTRGQGRDLAAARCLGERRARGSPWFGAASSLFSERHTPQRDQCTQTPPSSRCRPQVRAPRRASVSGTQGGNGPRGGNGAQNLLSHQSSAIQCKHRNRKAKTPPWSTSAGGGLGVPDHGSEREGTPGTLREGCQCEWPPSAFGSPLLVVSRPSYVSQNINEAPFFSLNTVAIYARSQRFKGL